MNYGFVIGVNGHIENYYPKNGSDFSLVELRNFIGGGFIEVIQIGKNREFLLVIDEEGKLKGFPTNPTATRMLETTYGQPRAYIEDVIVGPAFICPKEMIK